MTNWRATSIAALVLGVFGANFEAAPADVRNVRPAIESPIAPRGGVMMIPLVAERPGDNWPRTLEVTIQDGPTLIADVAWVELDRSTSREVGWTDDPRRLTIRAIDRTDDDARPLNRAAGEGPYVLVRLPEDGSGVIRVAGRTLTPRWRDVPWFDPLRAAGAPVPDEAMPLIAGHDRPDPDSPFEYWRWVLLADRLGLRPPAPVGDDIQRRAAEHAATLWRIALARIARISLPVAAEVRLALSSIVLDRGRPIATWVSDPVTIAELLSTILDMPRDEDALEAAIAWLEQQPPLILWPEDQSGDRVQLAIAPTTEGVLDARMQWQGATGPAASARIEPGVVSHVSVERLPRLSPPSLTPGDEVEPPVQTLLIDAGDQSVQVPCGSRVLAVRPPGATFRPLHPPLTLADVRFNRTPEATADRATHVQIRRLAGRWEVFADCRRVTERRQSLQADGVRGLDDLRGVEAFTLLLGDNDAEGWPAIWLTVPEHEWPVVVRGENDADLQVHRRSYADRWLCRIVLPERWFSASETNPAFAGFIRGHGDSRNLDTGPAASPPWRLQPGCVALDLAQWDDLPGFEPEP